MNKQIRILLGSFIACLRNLRRTKAALFIILIYTINTLFFQPLSVLALGEPEVFAGAACLLDVTDPDNIKELYKKNKDEVMYPGSLTKIMTVLTASMYLNEGEIITAGDEVDAVPFDAKKTGHVFGEKLSVETLFRALIIGTGNESACVIAREVAKRSTGETQTNYQSAERIFCNLMNQLARDLGCKNTYFVNPYGYHNAKQTTTAYDMALITKAAMENELIRTIAMEESFSGNGAGENAEPGWKTQNYTWKNTNLLLAEPPYGYQYATGLRPGNIIESGYCLAAAAEREGRKLVCVVLFSDEANRWTDTIKLFDYGFLDFKNRTIQEPDILIDTVPLYNPRLGSEDVVEVYTTSLISGLFSEAEAERIKLGVVYDEDKIAKYTEEEKAAEGFENITKLKLPLSEGEKVGKVTYYLDGAPIAADDLIVKTDIAARNFNSDVDYNIALIKDFLTSGRAIPLWVGLVVLLFGAVHLTLFIRRKKEKKVYKMRRRY